ncbi:MAG TPA: hypothetical protein VM052_05335, partial [Candidatus Limnocylindrales bacterium]|nr:hypothetical protein [Candidatus Limnocylindrales bacterium]
GVLPRWLGQGTMAFAVAAITAAVLTAPLGTGTGIFWTLERLVVGGWALAVSYALWRTRTAVP